MMAHGEKMNSPMQRWAAGYRCCARSSSQGGGSVIHRRSRARRGHPQKMSSGVDWQHSRSRECLSELRLASVTGPRTTSTAMEIGALHATFSAASSGARETRALGRALSPSPPPPFLRVTALRAPEAAIHHRRGDI